MKNAMPTTTASRPNTRSARPTMTSSRLRRTSIDPFDPDFKSEIAEAAKKWVKATKSKKG
jgi:hypothetical protein